MTGDEHAGAVTAVARVAFGKACDVAQALLAKR
jgi:hypothetical protein